MSSTLLYSYLLLYYTHLSFSCFLLCFSLGRYLYLFYFTTLFYYYYFILIFFMLHNFPLLSATFLSVTLLHYTALIYYTHLIVYMNLLDSNLLLFTTLLHTPSYLLFYYTDQIFFSCRSRFSRCRPWYLFYFTLLYTTLLYFTVA